MSQTRIELQIAIDPGGLVFTLGELAALLPELGIGIAPALERSAPRFAGRVVVDEGEQEGARIVARHLARLREFSKHHPKVSITIAVVPDGGVLRLQAGSFGDDEDELASLLGSIADDEIWRLYVSFRIEPDAHRHLTELIERALPAGIVPVVDASETGLAVARPRATPPW